MTDRYLVRGKRRDNGEWAVGYGYVVESQSDIAFIHIAPTTHHSHPICMVDPTTLGQCTGIKDKTGKRIFEGDILEDHLGCGVVQWMPEHCAFLVYTKFPGGSSYHYLESDGQLRKTEIIGNIHDNPELLTKEDVAHEQPEI